MQQLYTGFRLLQRRGSVKLEQTIVREEIRNAHSPQHARYARYAHQRVVVNKHVTVHYDVHDSREIDEEYLDKSDFYFKRSYSSPGISIS